MAAVAAEPKSRGIDYSKFDNIEDSDDEKPTNTASPSAPPRPAEKPTCHGCGKDVAEPKKCSQCKRVTYCSQACQRADWQYHKRGCKKPEEPKAPPESKPPPSSSSSEKKEAKAKKAEEKVVDDGDENLTWYRHREWKPTAEPKRDFAPAKIESPADAPVKVEAQATTEGSAWNAAGTWEDKDVTEFAHKIFKEHLKGFPTIDAAGGAIDIEDVDSVEGDAWKPVSRGRRLHMFDLSFKIKFTFKWMDSSGQRQIKGSIEVTDFTHDVFAEGVASKPDLRLSCPDLRVLDAGRKQATEAALGHKSWPPAAGTAMKAVEEKLKSWAAEYEKAG
mmetsp:Transcript_35180/g.74868  ORF Transcript_35180/g.74868 Transcript_35180/m.74868 type:complete len:332 (+) Transcript_35180:161-1156(+)